MLNTALRKTNFFRQVATRLDHIVLVRGHNNNMQPVWHYVLVDPGKLKTFQSNEGAATLELSHFGKILYSGFGCEPSALAAWQMKQRYGFVH